MTHPFPCPACAVRRLHTPDDWAYHPYAGHGYDGARWTHSDLESAPQPAGGVTVSQPGEVCLAAPPAGAKK